MESALEFKDHFSERAALYRTYRPHYPDTLFRLLADLAPGHSLAVDTGTGNGQAAVGLARYFNRVIATDPSVPQLANARAANRVEYKVARAEATGVSSGSVDLVTAAQALHWFDTSAFFAEAKRILRPRGVIAVWGYGDPVLDTGLLDRALHEFNRGMLEPYWFPERNLLLQGYRTIQFPFSEIEVPVQELEMQWTLDELAGYLRTWSATARYVAERGVDPVTQLESALRPAWGDAKRRRRVRWPLYLRAGHT
jgi:SAM-dependent methyltransferase